MRVDDTPWIIAQAAYNRAALLGRTDHGAMTTLVQAHLHRYPHGINSAHQREPEPRAANPPTT